MDSGRHSSDARRRIWPWLLGLWAAHVATLSYFEPPSLVFSTTPIAGVDYETHVEQTWRVLEALRGWGKSWQYDPRLLAGYPSGTIFDADNKGWELWTYALSRMGVPQGLAFNLFVVAAHLGLVPALYAAARLWSLTPARAVVAAALGSWLWIFDSYAHWCWWIGMTAYAAAAYLSLIPLGLLRRYLRERRLHQVLALGVTLALIHLIHPYTFVALVVPMTWMFTRAWPELWPRHRAAVLGAAAFVIAVNAYWLEVAIRFWHYILDSAYYGQGHPRFVLTDFLGLLQDPSTTGAIATQTAMRFMVFTLAAVGLLRWHRSADGRARPLAIALMVLAFLAYCGGFVPLFAQVQPYRHILPAMFLATIPAADALANWVGSRPWRAAPHRPALILLFVVGTQALAKEATFYFAERLPAVEKLPDGSSTHLTPLGHGQKPEYRHTPTPPVALKLERWVADHVGADERVLVEVGMIGERLLWATDAQVIGGFPERNLAHSHANHFREGGAPKSETAFREYLTRYSIQWIIVTHPNPWLERIPGVEFHKRIGFHRIYRTGVPVALSNHVGAQVTVAPNEIRVRASDPDRALELRFHWMETLRCRHDCRVERIDVASDPVGFIRVPAPHPAEFTIYNSYTF